MLALLAYLPDAARENMVRMYRQALDEQLVLIGAGLESDAGDATALTAAVHKIAGSSGMMQDQPLSQVARAMELDLREGRRAQARTRWPELQACADRTRQALLTAYPQA